MNNAHNILLRDDIYSAIFSMDNASSALSLIKSTPQILKSSKASNSKIICHSLSDVYGSLLIVVSSITGTSLSCA